MASAQPSFFGIPKRFWCSLQLREQIFVRFGSKVNPESLKAVVSVAKATEYYAGVWYLIFNPFATYVSEQDIWSSAGH